MNRFSFILLSFLFAAFSANSALAQNSEIPISGNVAAEFEKLKSLAGDWQAKGPDGLSVDISYQVVANGSAVMETRKPEKEPSMLTLFHLDGDALMMAHYCSIGNQPRMRTEKTSRESNDLYFKFVDATNLAKPSDGHMRSLTFTFNDKNHITQVWTWREDGKDMPATFHLVRKE